MDVFSYTEGVMISHRKRCGIKRSSSLNVCILFTASGIAEQNGILLWNRIHCIVLWRDSVARDASCATQLSTLHSNPTIQPNYSQSNFVLVCSRKISKCYLCTQAKTSVAFYTEKESCSHNVAMQMIQFAQDKMPLPSQHNV